jgi:7-carboxy-7-deazaguanine synthase
MYKTPLVEISTVIQGEGKLAGVPHILLRTTGCDLRCQFKKDSFCDSPHTSWKPEKGDMGLYDVIEVVKANPQIKHVMITGGEPTMHSDWLVETCQKLRSEYGMFITLETAGTNYLTAGVDLLSLSPKLRSSRPIVGTYNPIIKREVTEEDYAKHEAKRRNFMIIRQQLGRACSYQIKPVCSNEDDLEEISEFCAVLNIPYNKVYLMPEGLTDEQLSKSRIWLFGACIKHGYNYTDRLHIITYGDLRGV